MTKLYNVKNKIALITGASSGIGRSFASTLAKEGAHLILLGRHEERLKAAERECQQFGVKTLSLVADVKDSSSVERIMEESKKQFPELDILINAAGIGMRVPALELSETQWDDVLDTNLKGTFLVSQAAAKWMIETKTAGKIINISSAAAFHTTLTRSPYSASKIAVESITRSLALSLIKHKIRVNCIAPGFFVTELTKNYLETEEGKAEIGAVPAGRAAHVSELEGALLLLASEASSYITGSVIHVDGGLCIQKT